MRSAKEMREVMDQIAQSHDNKLLCLIIELIEDRARAGKEEIEFTGEDTTDYIGRNLYQFELAGYEVLTNMDGSSYKIRWGKNEKADTEFFDSIYDKL